VLDERDVRRETPAVREFEDPLQEERRDVLSADSLRLGIRLGQRDPAGISSAGISAAAGTGFVMSMPPIPPPMARLVRSKSAMASGESSRSGEAIGEVRDQNAGTTSLP